MVEVDKCYEPKVCSHLALRRTMTMALIRKGIAVLACDNLIRED